MGSTIRKSGNGARLMDPSARWNVIRWSDDRAKVVAAVFSICLCPCVFFETIIFVYTAPPKSIMYQLSSLVDLNGRPLKGNPNVLNTKGE